MTPFLLFYLKQKAMAKHTVLLFSFLATITASFSQNNYKEISLLQLMQQTKEPGKYLILDVRTAGEYMDTVQGGKHIGIGRIKSAVNVPLQDLLQKPEAVKQLEQYKNEDVYVICSHSYRSRRISNLLLENGFTRVHNVQGGMTEWYRNYQQLEPYMTGTYENNIAYHNMAPVQLFQKIQGKEPIEVIGFKNQMRSFFDSLSGPLYQVFPEIRNVLYYTTSDSLQILEKIKTSGDKPFVFFSTIGGGATETAEWLTRKGYVNSYNLLGNLTGFFEYIANYQPASFNAVMQTKSKIVFYTPLSFCRSSPKNVQWLDIRHDTTFNKVTKGTKIDYKTIKGAVNFPFYKTADEFAKQFTDKSKLYVIIPQDGYKGVELATELTNKGYRIGWLLGGIERWEWYTNNIGEFTCRDYFVK